MRVYNIPLQLTSTTLNTNITSQALQLYSMLGFSIQIVFTGTPTGTLKLQGSSDPVPQADPNSLVPTNWTDINNSSQAISAAGSFLWNVSDVQYNYVRLVYTDGSSGMSTAVVTSAIFNGKGF